MCDTHYLPPADRKREKGVRFSSTHSLPKAARGDSPTGDTRLTHGQNASDTPLLYRTVPTIFDPQIHTSDTTRSARDAFLREIKREVVGNCIRETVDETQFFNTSWDGFTTFRALCRRQYYRPIFRDPWTVGIGTYAHLHAPHARSVFLAIAAERGVRQDGETA